MADTHPFQQLRAEAVDVAIDTIATGVLTIEPPAVAVVGGAQLPPGQPAQLRAARRPTDSARFDGVAGDVSQRVTSYRVRVADAPFELVEGMAVTYREDGWPADGSRDLRDRVVRVDLDAGGLAALLHCESEEGRW